MLIEQAACSGGQGESELDGGSGGGQHDSGSSSWWHVRGPKTSSNIPHEEGPFEDSTTGSQILSLTRLRLRPTRLVIMDDDHSERPAHGEGIPLRATA